MGTLETTNVAIGELAKRVHAGELALPEIQRSFVWKRPQVRDLLDSLYRQYPVGTLLFWRSSDLLHSRGLETAATSNSAGRVPEFVLDGQQRLTALARVIFDGDPDIRFNIEDEQFEVANAVTKRDPKWIPVSEVFQKGPISVARERGLLQGPNTEQDLVRLNNLDSIQKIPVQVHTLVNFDYEEATEVFVRVNSKGTRLRQTELAIAQLAFRIPGMVTDKLKEFEDELDGGGYEIDLRFLMRCLTAIATGQSRYPALNATGEKAIEQAWDVTRDAIEYFLNLAKENLGLESWDWVPSSNALVVPVAYLAQRRFSDVDSNGLLRWFLLSSMWSRYGGASETKMDQDLRLLDGPSPFHALENSLLQDVGRLEVSADDLDDSGVNSPFFLATYLACRKRGAHDWATNVQLSTTNLGTRHTLELHHIFPRAHINTRYSSKDVNEIANIAFISKIANLRIGKKKPKEYLTTIPKERLDQQFVPLTPELWELDSYQTFLETRRKSIAEGINDFLASLRTDSGEANKTSDTGSS